jgi:hypothetical protein
MTAANLMKVKMIHERLSSFTLSLDQWLAWRPIRQLQGIRQWRRHVSVLVMMDRPISIEPSTPLARLSQALVLHR